MMSGPPKVVIDPNSDTWRQVKEAALYWKGEHQKRLANINTDDRTTNYLRGRLEQLEWLLDLATPDLIQAPGETYAVGSGLDDKR